MAITVPQIPQAISTAKELGHLLQDLTMLLEQAKELSDKGWQIDIGSRYPIIVSISPAQQAGMVASYDGIKSQLVTMFQQLP